MAWLSTDLIAQVRRTAFMPSVSEASGGYSDADIMFQADEVLSAEIVPMVITMREEWYVKTLDISIQANVDSYRLPNRNIGGRVRDVQLIRGSIPYNLARYEPETYLNFVNGMNPGLPTGFIMQNNALVLVPSPQSSTDTLRIKYFFRPNTLCAPTSAASASQFFSITPSGGSNQLIQTTGLHGLSIGSVIDMVRNTPNFELVFYSATVIAVPSTTTFTVATSSLPADLVAGTNYDSYVGSWISLAGTTPVLQAPVELQRYWAELTACKVMEAHGDAANAQLSMKRADRYRKGMMDLLAPRTEGEPRKLLGGMLFNRGFTWWR